MSEGKGDYSEPLLIGQFLKEKDEEQQRELEAYRSEVARLKQRVRELEEERDS